MIPFVKRILACHEGAPCVILFRMKAMIAQLRLSTDLLGSTRAKCPSIIFTYGDEEITAIRTDDECAHLPLANSEIDEVILYDDLLSRVIDEEGWLHELARVLIPGGLLRLTLPADGTWAWLDAMNAYRYVVDTSKRGDPPDSTGPSGWNRHYSRQQVESLLIESGFEGIVIIPSNYVREEVGFLTGLLNDNWLRGERSAEQQLFLRFGRRNPRQKSRLLRTTWTISAYKHG